MLLQIFQPDLRSHFEAGGKRGEREKGRGKGNEGKGRDGRKHPLTQNKYLVTALTAAHAVMLITSRRATAAVVTVVLAW